MFHPPSAAQFGRDFIVKKSTFTLLNIFGKCNCYIYLFKILMSNKLINYTSKQ